MQGIIRANERGTSRPFKTGKNTCIKSGGGKELIKIPTWEFRTAGAVLKQKQNFEKGG